METILAFDCSQSALSVALRYQGTLFFRHQVLPRLQAQLILPVIDELLKEAGIALQEVDFVGVGCGPGSFTGVRIAVCVAQGLAFSCNLPIVPVSSLACIAEEVYVTEGYQHVVVAVDARLQEVYCGEYHYDKTVGRMRGEDQLCQPQLLASKIERSEAIVGNALSVYAPIAPISDHIYQNNTLLPKAEFLIRLAEKIETRILPSEAQPVYYRGGV